MNKKIFNIELDTLSWEKKFENFGKCQLEILVVQNGKKVLKFTKRKFLIVLIKKLIFF